MSPRPRLDHVRRPQILEAAVEALHERGLHATRIEDVAKRAGTSAPNVLYYFSSKEALLAEALAFDDAQFLASLSDELAGIEAAGDKLTLFVERCAFPVSPLHDWTLWIETQARALHHPGLRDACDRGTRAWIELLTDIIRAGQARGEFADTPAEDLAVSLMAMMDALGGYVRLGVRGITGERMVDLCLRFAGDRLECRLQSRLASSSGAG